MTYIFTYLYIYILICICSIIFTYVYLHHFSPPAPGFWFFRGRRITMYAKAKTKVLTGRREACFFQGRSARMYPDLPTWAPGKWEIPNYKPYSSWVFMGKLSPRIPRLNTINKYHGSTRTLGVHPSLSLDFWRFCFFFFKHHTAGQFFQRDVTNRPGPPKGR